MPERQSARSPGPDSRATTPGGDTSLSGGWLLAAVALWAGAVAAVGIGGDFPLSDDWSYAHVVRSLCEGRGFDLLPWTGASLVVQALYGAAACKLAGFSYEVLRIGTLLLSVVGVAAFHGLLRELGADRRTVAAGVAVLAFSPLWFHLSFTFMTDVPFAALALVAAWLYVRGLGRGSRGTLLLAGAAAAASFLVRQHAMSIAVAAAVAAVWTAREHRWTGSGAAARKSLADAGAALALPLLAAAVWSWWAATSGDVPLAVQNKLREAASTSLLPAADAAFRALVTLGFLLLPWTVTLRPARGTERRGFAALLVLLSAVALFLFFRDGSLMFYLTNTLDLASVGAVTTRDVLFLDLPARPGSAAGLLRVFLTAVSIVSIALAATRLLAAAPRLLVSTRAGATDPPTAKAPALFCLLAFALSGLGTLAQSHYYFDRYVLVLVPLAVASLVALSPGPRFGAGFVAALLLMSLYSVAGTHDYLAWNRARWDLLVALENRGISPRSIDGGVEYNAERLAARLGTAPTDAQARSGQPSTSKSWWWVVDDEWVIAFGPLDGYAEADSRPYARWLPPSEGRVFALHRSGDAVPVTGPPDAGKAGTPDAGRVAGTPDAGGVAATPPDPGSTN
ncbi:MAG: glycosyltransferase family 39 protein [Candidatus Binatia bacterium]